MNKFKILAIAGALLLAVAYVASPYVAAGSLGSAIANRDAEAISDQVDFPLLRDSIKTGFKAEIARKIASSPSQEGRMAAMGAMFAGAMLDQMVDTYVTPSGIRTIMDKAAEKVGSRGKGDGLDYDTEYRSLDRFAIRVKSDNPASGQIVLVMHRRGLFSWKVSEIEMPLGELGAGPKAPLA